jgi:hypothetical protein
MKIIFTKNLEGLEAPEGWTAICNNVEYNGQMCDELLYASIDKTSKGYCVRWEDSYSERHDFDTLEDAQQLILLSYFKHTPHVNGNTYDLENE